MMLILRYLKRFFYRLKYKERQTFIYLLSARSGFVRGHFFYTQILHINRDYVVKKSIVKEFSKSAN